MPVRMFVSGAPACGVYTCTTLRPVLMYIKALALQSIFRKCGDNLEVVSQSVFGCPNRLCGYLGPKECNYCSFKSRTWVSYASGIRTTVFLHEVWSAPCDKKCCSEHKTLFYFSGNKPILSDMIPPSPYPMQMHFRVEYQQLNICSWPQ